MTSKKQKCFFNKKLECINPTRKHTDSFCQLCLSSQKVQLLDQIGYEIFCLTEKLENVETVQL